MWMASSWADVAVPALLILAWLVVSPIPSRLLSWPKWKKASGSSSSYGEVEAAGQSSGAATAAAAARNVIRLPGRRDSAPGYVLPVLIHHARMLPKESQHRFRYPSIFLALNLADLDAGRADLPRVFAASPSSSQWALTRLDAEGFGRRAAYFSGGEEEQGDRSSSSWQRRVSKSILLKLMYELRLRGHLSAGPQDVSQSGDFEGTSTPWSREVGQVWAVAMPSLLGMGGFNPLTIYYVYRPAERQGGEGDEGGHERGKLWLVVLEVHNTFNERHVYINQVGLQEDTTRRRGYQHSWTFPRAFHVSPFNDRLGYYQLLLSDLWRSSSSLLPTLDVRLLLLVPEGEDGSEKQPPSPSPSSPQRLQKKLLATLTSNSASSASLRPHRAAQVMTSKSMMTALLSQPFDLVLPVSRIMWEAAKLHWNRRLPVFIRPEQRGQGLQGGLGGKGGEAQTEERGYDGVGWPVDLNPTEQRRPNTSASGAIYWNQDSFVEQACQRQFEQYVCQQTVAHPTLSLCIVSQNAEVEPSYFYQGQKIKQPPINDDTCTLTIYTLSSSIYLDFAIYAPSQARLFGSIVDRNWGVSSVADYERLFSPSVVSLPDNPSRKVRAAIWARRAHLRWAINAAASPSHTNDTTQSVHCHLLDQVTSHPFNTLYTPPSFLIALLTQLLLIRLIALLSSLLHIRYVRTPWAQVGEGLQRLYAKT